MNVANLLAVAKRIEDADDFNLLNPFYCVQGYIPRDWRRLWLRQPSIAEHFDLTPEQGRSIYGGGWPAQFRRGKTTAKQAAAFLRAIANGTAVYSGFVWTMKEDGQ